MTAKTILRARRPFRDWRYCYWLGRERLYSASRVIRDLGLKPDFSDVDEAVVRKAACRGKLTEGYCYRLLAGEPVTIRSKHCGSLQDDVSVRVEAFYRWMEKYKPTEIEIGGIVWSVEDQVAWETDFRCTIAGVRTLVDIKCTSTTAKDWPLQLGCGLTYDPSCQSAAILRLNPKMNKAGYRFIDFPAAKVREQWGRAVRHWRSEHDFNRLKAEMGFESEAKGFETEEDAA